MVRKIKVMQITHDLAIGGLQQVVVNLCRTIDKARFDVSVLCLRELGEFVPEIEKMGIKVILLPQKENGTDYLSFVKVAKILKQEEVDVIHTHNTQPFVDGTIGALFSYVKTIVHTDHARNFPDKIRYMAMEWLMSKFAYRVVGVSEHTSQNLIRYEKISSKKIVTIPNGIDQEVYKKEVDRSQKRQELGIREKGPIIGLCVRLTEQKGITYLLKAMPDVIQVFPDVTLVIAGKGDLEDSLKNESRELGIEGNVEFIGPRLDIPELLRLYDLYVLPSLWEGLPMVIIEALAAECPVVATNVGGNYTAIEDGVNGLLVKPKDPKVLSAAIIKLLRDRKTATEYARKGLEIFETKFSASIMTKAYEQLYERRL